jgi:hypothetical protein
VQKNALTPKGVFVQIEHTRDDDLSDVMCSYSQCVERFDFFHLLNGDVSMYNYCLKDD